jgi:hypothetical protein
MKDLQLARIFHFQSERETDAAKVASASAADMSFSEEYVMLNILPSGITESAPAGCLVVLGSAMEVINFALFTLNKWKFCNWRAETSVTWKPAHSSS